MSEKFVIYYGDYPWDFINDKIFFYEYLVVNLDLKYGGLMWSGAFMYWMLSADFGWLKFFKNEF